MYNPFASLAVHRNFAAHGNGGIDFSPIPNPYTIYACAAGTVSQYFYDSAGNSWLTIEVAANVSYSLLHMKSRFVALGDTVTQGQALGLAGGASGDDGQGQSSGRHVHWHFTVNGTRVDPIQYVASGTATPANTRRSMTTRFAKMGTGTPPGGLNTLVALAGDAGYACDANWQEYVRNPADTSTQDRAYLEFKVHGDIVWIPANQWEALRAAYRGGGPLPTV